MHTTEWHSGLKWRQFFKKKKRLRGKMIECKAHNEHILPLYCCLYLLFMVIIALFLKLARLDDHSLCSKWRWSSVANESCSVAEWSIKELVCTARIRPTCLRL